MGKGSASYGMRKVVASARRQSRPIMRKTRAWRGAAPGEAASWRAAASSMAVRASSHDRLGTGERSHMSDG